MDTQHKAGQRSHLLISSQQATLALYCPDPRRPGVDCRLPLRCQSTGHALLLALLYWVRFTVVWAGIYNPRLPPPLVCRCRELAEACLHSDPRARPTSAELVARLRALLAESGALQHTINRRPAPHAAAAAAAGLGGGLGGGGGFPGAATAAAAGAMLGIDAAKFARPDAWMAMGAGGGGGAAAQPPAGYPSAFGGAHRRRSGSADGMMSVAGGAGAWGAPAVVMEEGTSEEGSPQEQGQGQAHHSGRRGKSRSYAGGSGSSFPLHIL